MRLLRWSRRATRDLVDIGDFIAEDDPIAARRWIERLRAKAAITVVTPMAGRRVPEFGREDVREVFLRTYRIVYRVSAQEILVLAVVEGHRRLRRLNRDAPP